MLCRRLKKLPAEVRAMDMEDFSMLVAWFGSEEGEWLEAMDTATSDEMDDDGIRAAMAAYRRNSNKETP